jgi:hypothetical protein
LGEFVKIFVGRSESLFKSTCQITSLATFELSNELCNTQSKLFNKSIYLYSGCRILG